MKDKYPVLLCSQLEAIPCDAQQLILDYYQVEDLIGMLKQNDKCLIIYPPFQEVQEDEK
jgi:hypothetical protein